MFPLFTHDGGRSLPSAASIKAVLLYIEHRGD